MTSVLTAPWFIWQVRFHLPTSATALFQSQISHWASRNIFFSLKFWCFHYPFLMRRPKMCIKAAWWEPSDWLLSRNLSKGTTSPHESRCAISDLWKEIQLFFWFPVNGVTTSPNRISINGFVCPSSQQKLREWKWGVIWGQKLMCIKTRRLSLAKSPKVRFRRRYLIRTLLFFQHYITFLSSCYWFIADFTSALLRPFWSLLTPLGLLFSPGEQYCCTKFHLVACTKIVGGATSTPDPRSLLCFIFHRPVLKITKIYKVKGERLKMR